VGRPIIPQSLLETGQRPKGLAPALEDVRLKEAVSPRAGGADEKRERLSRPGVGQQFFGCREEDDAVH